jgi:hypothetical protein
MQVLHIALRRRKHANASIVKWWSCLKKKKTTRNLILVVRYVRAGMDGLDALMAELSTSKVNFMMIQIRMVFRELIPSCGRSLRQRTMYKPHLPRRLLLPAAIPAPRRAKGASKQSVPRKWKTSLSDMHPRMMPEWEVHILTVCVVCVSSQAMCLCLCLLSFPWQQFSRGKIRSISAYVKWIYMQEIICKRVYVLSVCVCFYFSKCHEHVGMCKVFVMFVHARIYVCMHAMYVFMYVRVCVMYVHRI